MKKLLVTTALQETWGENNYLFFAGEWCKEYHNKSTWEQRQFAVLPYHWRNRNKIKFDHAYLNKLYEKILLALVNALNKYHNIEKSLKYWRLVLGPWLIVYVAVVWDRWETLRLAFEKWEFDETYIIDREISKYVPNDYHDSINLFEDHLWNHLLYSDILKSIFQDKVKIKNISFSEIHLEKVKREVKNKSLKWKLIHLVDSILRLLQNNYKVVIVEGYLSPKALLLLALKLKQIPRIHHEFDDKIIMSNQARFKGQMEFDFKVDNKFEKFIVDNLINHIPIAYMEGYSDIKEKINLNFPRCEIIYTANFHYGNELFKVWCAEMIENNKKLIVSAHGGALRSEMTDFFHEEKIACKKIVWQIPFNKKHVQLSPNKVIGYNVRNKSKKHITVVGLELYVYSLRCSSGPFSSLIIDDYEQKLFFIKLLRNKAKRALKVRPAPNSGWNTKQRYIDDLGGEIISPYKTYREAISNSRLIVCTYPQTTFFEAMYSGVPTILLYTEEFWEIGEEFHDLINKLKNANVIFSSSISAANHVNLIWNNIDDWWDSDKVTQARKDFFDLCGQVSEDWKNEWSSFFINELQK